MGFNAGGGDLVSLAPLDVPEPITLTMPGLAAPGRPQPVAVDGTVHRPQLGITALMRRPGR